MSENRIKLAPDTVAYADGESGVPMHSPHSPSGENVSQALSESRVSGQLLRNSVISWRRGYRLTSSEGHLLYLRWCRWI